MALNEVAPTRDFDFCVGAVAQPADAVSKPAVTKGPRLSPSLAVS